MKANSKDRIVDLSEYAKDGSMSKKDIIRMMKSSGLSYKQIVEQARKVAQQVDIIAKEKEEEGVDFDKKAFLKEQAEMLKSGDIPFVGGVEKGMG